MNSIELPNKHVTCPACGEILDGSTCVTHDEMITPKDGDIGICFKCGTLLEYEEGFFVHELPKTILEGLKILQPEAYNQLIFTQKIIQEFRRSQMIQQQ